MSLRLMTCRIVRLPCRFYSSGDTHILMPEMLQKLQLAVGALGEDGCAERLHDLLDSNGLACELILGRAAHQCVRQGIAQEETDVLTKQDRKHPFRRVASRCICKQVSHSSARTYCLCPLPAGDLKGCAKDLGTHEFGHGDSRGAEDRLSLWMGGDEIRGLKRDGVGSWWGGFVLEWQAGQPRVDDV
jgi:hypothetical protein